MVLDGRIANFHLHTKFITNTTFFYLASERSEQDTIGGVQIRAGAVCVCIYIYMYGGTCSIIVAHATYT